MSMVRKLGLVSILLALIAVLVPASAFAQFQTGSILVKVADEQGGTIPGASVTITSNVLPSPRTGVTDSEGMYRFPSLSVGTYTIKAAIQGFESVVRPGVIVLQGQTATIDMALKVGAMSTEVTVKSESPVVDTKIVGSAINIDKNILEQTPGGKDIWSILEYKAPGVTIDGGNPPDVGGNQGGLQRSMSARGTPNGQNTQMLNGVNINDPASQGFSMKYYIPSAFENIEVTTSAQDISIGTGGVFINMVTKSGSNRRNGLFLDTYQGAHTQSTNVDTAQQNAGLTATGNVSNLITNSNFQLGGPLLKNKLFYFGSLNYQQIHVSVLGFPAVPPASVPTVLASTSTQDTTNTIAAEGKLNYQLGAKNRFEGYLSKQRYDKPNRGLSAANTQDSDLKELDTFVIEQLSWNLTLSNRMFVDSKISYNNTHFPLSQKTALQPLADAASGLQLRNTTSTALMFRRRLEAVSNWQYFVPKFVGGRHEFKAGVDNGYTPEDVHTTGVDNVRDNSAGTPPTGSTVSLFSWPTYLSRAVMTTALYGQDSYSMKRLTVTGGVRWERVEGLLPAQHNPASTYFPAGTSFTNVTIGGIAYPVFTVQDTFAPLHGDPLWKNVAPRINFAYDVTGKGKTVLKFSVGKYLDQISTGTPPNPNGTINQNYNWNDANGDLVFQPGTLVWNPSTAACPTGCYTGGELGTLRTTTLTNPAGAFDKSLRRPTRNELTVSVDRELAPNFLLTLSYLHTREHNNQGTVDQSTASWPSIYSLVTLTDPGPDGVINSSTTPSTDDRSLQVYNLNATTGGAVISTKTLNDDRLAVHYNGMEVIATKRYSNRSQLLFSYDYSHTRQALLGLANPNQVSVFGGGESGGRRHILKASGSREIPGQVQLAFNYRWQSGLPFTRQWLVPTCSGTVLTNCISTSGNATNLVNTEPRGSEELPALSTIDFRAGRAFRIGGQRFDLSVDLYNVTNANTVWQTRTTTGLTNIRVGGLAANPLTSIQTFNSPTGVLSPRVLRFNVTYTFGGA
jgi:Carboxypeptidase regulatory-like domain/TonB-dependent Receptor Plug Domain